MTLISTTTLTFTRPSDVTVSPSGRVVESGTETTTEANGSLQPLRLGTQTVSTPEGKRLIGALRFYTKTSLKSFSDATGAVGDETVINGVTYQVFDDGDWTFVGSDLGHYKYILRRVENVNG